MLRVVIFYNARGNILSSEYMTRLNVSNRCMMLCSVGSLYIAIVISMRPYQLSPLSTCLGADMRFPPCKDVRTRYLPRFGAPTALPGNPFLVSSGLRRRHHVVYSAYVELLRLSLHYPHSCAARDSVYGRPDGIYSPTLGGDWDSNVATVR